MNEHREPLPASGSLWTGRRGALLPFDLPDECGGLTLRAHQPILVFKSPNPRVTGALVRQVEAFLELRPGQTAGISTKDVVDRVPEFHEPHEASVFDRRAIEGSQPHV